MPKGFFPQTIWKKQARPLPLIPDCDKCGLYKLCNSPKMPVSGKGRRRVLIVAEAPGENEDRQGYQLVGNAGMELVKILYKLGINMRKDCWLTNANICRPTDENGSNRTPTDSEIAYCRPNLIKTLKELSPDVIIPLGESALKSLIPLAWKDGEVSDVGAWVGWNIPSVKLNAWICPTYHPSFLLRNKEPVIALMMTNHLREAFKHKSKPWKEKPDWENRVFRLYNSVAAAKAIREMMIQGEPLAFDYETNMKKPDSDKAEIICCSLSNGRESIAFPWDGEAIEAMSDFLRSDIPKIGANLQFEERWTRKKLGFGVRNWRGGWDTVTGAHWLDCRSGICSVKFQSFVLLGAEDYSSWVEPFLRSKDSNSPNRIREIGIPDLLLYCGLDSLFEYLIAQKQMKEAGV